MQITIEMIDRNTVFHCDTEEKANELLGKLDYLGYKWKSEDSYLDDNYYHFYKEDTCYNPYEKMHGYVDFYKNMNYKIIKYILDKDVRDVKFVQYY